MLKAVQAVLNLLEESIWVYSWIDNQDFTDACQSLYDDVREVIFSDVGFLTLLEIDPAKLQAIIRYYPQAAAYLQPNWLSQLIAAYNYMLLAAQS
jgi:hypothetical protein